MATVEQEHPAAENKVARPPGVEAPPEWARAERVPERERRVSAEVTLGGSTLSALCGAGVLILTILGLATVVPPIMAGVSVIVLASALLLKALGIGARYPQLVEATMWRPGAVTDIGSAMVFDFLAGTAGMILGILALIGYNPLVLGPVSVLIFGTSFMLASGFTARVNALTRRSQEEARSFRFADVSALSGAAFQAMVGLAAIVLAIIALVVAAPAILTLVALLVLGSGLLLSESFIAARLLGGLRH